MIPEVESKQFVLTNTQHTSGLPIADHMIAMMTMLMRGLHNFYRIQLEGVWKERPIGFPVVEFSDKAVLIVGLGGIGTKVSLRAHGLGMRVLAVRNSSRNGSDHIECVGLSDELLELAKQADVVVNTLPLTEATRGTFDRQFFGEVKRGGYFISCGRGETTVTEDLISALKDGRLTAAVLDGTDHEPLPEEHELWTLPNVVITPHIAAMTH